MSPDFNVTVEAKVTCEREAFFANESKKNFLIKLLAQEMAKSNIKPSMQKMMQTH